MIVRYVEAKKPLSVKQIGIYLRQFKEIGRSLNCLHFRLICTTVGLDMVKYPIGLWRALRKASVVLRKFTPDVVHGNMVHANIFSRLLRLMVLLPYLINIEHNKNIDAGFAF